ncbi:MAG: SDR family NAD(P)-dependent oxidoreductase [Pseudomonadales bacterium]
MPDEQQKIIITGAAGGIGSAVSRSLASQGAQLMLVDIGESALHALRDELLAAGAADADVQVCVADVSEPVQVENYVQQTLQAFGGVNRFMNNAGIEGPGASIIDYPLEDFMRVMNINVTGVWLGMKYVLPAMRDAGGGSVIITSSVAGVIGSPNLSGYVTSKHAVIGIMRTAALEHAADDIRVNTIHPGMVDTKMAERIGENSGLGVAGFEELIRSKIPLGRYAQAEDIVGIVNFLFGESASYCTGQQYFVDGGITTG